MRDETTAFHREEEFLGRGVIPRAVAFGALERIEGAVNLDGTHLARGVFEFAVLRPTS